MSAAAGGEVTESAFVASTAERFFISDKVKVKSMVPDGNCMFRAFAFYIYKDCEKHSRVRKEICDYIDANFEDFERFILKNERKSWVKTMRKEGTWGDAICTQAAYFRYKIGIITWAYPSVNVTRAESEGYITEQSKCCHRWNTLQVYASWGCLKCFLARWSTLVAELTHLPTCLGSFNDADPKVLSLWYKNNNHYDVIEEDVEFLFSRIFSTDVYNYYQRPFAIAAGYKPTNDENEKVPLCGLK